MKKALKKIITFIFTTVLIIIPFAAEGLVEIPGVIEFTTNHLYKYVAIVTVLYTIFFIAYYYKKSKTKAKVKGNSRSVTKSRVVSDNSFYNEFKDLQTFRKNLKEIELPLENAPTITVQKVREAFPGASEKELIQAFAAAQKGLIKI